MTHKSLLAAAAAVSALVFASGAQAGGGKCPLSDRGDRVETRTTRVVADTDRTLRRVGDGLARTGDRLFNWGHRRPRS